MCLGGVARSTTHCWKGLILAGSKISAFFCWFQQLVGWAAYILLLITPRLHSHRRKWCCTALLHLQHARTCLQEHRGTQCLPQKPYKLKGQIDIIAKSRPPRSNRKPFAAALTSPPEGIMEQTGLEEGLTDIAVSWMKVGGTIWFSFSVKSVTLQMEWGNNSVRCASVEEELISFTCISSSLLS